MRAKKAMLALCCVMALFLLPTRAAFGAEAAPAWKLSVTALPSVFAPGSVGNLLGGPEYLILATNVGGKATSTPTTLIDTLPAEGVGVISTTGSCTVTKPTVTCAEANPIGPGRSMEVRVLLEVGASPPASLLNEATVQGGGATSVSAKTTTPTGNLPAPFDFLPGFAVPLNESDGSAAQLAGTHPYQLTTTLGFPTEKPQPKTLGGAGHVREVTVDLPPGEIVNPAATPVLCTEAELTSEGEPGCPDASQVGLVDLTTVVGSPEVNTAPLYNMVPPPGQAASLGFDAVGVGIYVHLSGSVRSDGDYGLSGTSSDILALTVHPVFGAQLQLWGDPSAKSHDEIRGACKESHATCPVEAAPTALLRTPTLCHDGPDITLAHADSWEQPGELKQAEYRSADLSGTAVSVQGCNQLSFEPSITAKPTTNLNDSPSGLDFDLKQPQSTQLSASPTADLKDATVTLPEGLVVNPSAAEGQAACEPTQIGLSTPVGQAAPIHFSKAPVSCPDASKLGSVEVVTPLLAQFDSATGQVALDPEKTPIPRPLHGSVYLAKPFANPFSSLLAIYITVEDPASGTVAKLAGEVRADPLSGRLSSKVSESPQLPIEDVRLHLFAGARAALRTPPACASYATSAALLPWAAPEVPAVTSSDSFQTTAAPGGAPCPTTASAAPNKPSFLAGTLA
ncbi:MAG TPA: hypothetical protein VN758_11705, partial [Solirubrobacterales bacterium]|nr:hypothetical protein [Solirubrobacterales bacterium]